MTTREEHVHHAVADALAMTQNLLSTTFPGRLHLLALRSNEDTDRLEMVFVLDSEPGLHYHYSHVLYDKRYSNPEPGLIDSNILGALVERVRTWRKTPVDGVIDLNNH